MFKPGDWREPAAADFDVRLKRLTGELRGVDQERVDLSKELRRIAAMRVPMQHQSRMQRLGKLAFASHAHLPGFRPMRVLAVGNKTLDFLAADLAAAGPARGLVLQMTTTGFDAATALAMDDQWAGPEGPFDAVLVMLDASAFAERVPLLDNAAEDARMSRAAAHLTRIVDGISKRIDVPVIVATLARDPASALSSSDGGMAGSATRLVSQLNAFIHAQGQARQWLVWDFGLLAERIGTFAFCDPVRMHLAKAPYALEYGPQVADSLAAKLAALAGRSGRALVLDLDNTIWGGVVADDGPEGLRLGQGSAEGEAFTAFQRLTLDWRDRGIVLTVCSKNVEAIAREPFKSHAEMLLREQHVAVFIANFDDKASNIRRIAQSLDLGLESLVFVDDNPAERERVRAELPFVHVPEMPEDVSYFPASLLDAGYFEYLPLTAEDLGRSDAYTGRARAAATLESIGNYDEYLQSLDMRISVKPFDPTGKARIAQLISKSNQFNLTTRRYSEVDVERLSADSNFICMQVRMKDRFADHGMISVVVIDKTEAHAWSIDTWLMSCRVLRRGVEQFLMNQVMQLAGEGGADVVKGLYVPTARNGLVADFFEQMTFETVADETAVGGGRHFEKSVSSYTPFQCFFQTDGA